MPKAIIEVSLDNVKGASLPINAAKNVPTPFSENRDFFGHKGYYNYFYCLSVMTQIYKVSEKQFLALMEITMNQFLAAQFHGMGASVSVLDKLTWLQHITLVASLPTPESLRHTISTMKKDATESFPLFLEKLRKKSKIAFRDKPTSERAILESNELNEALKRNCTAEQWRASDTVEKTPEQVCMKLEQLRFWQPELFQNTNANNTCNFGVTESEEQQKKANAATNSQGNALTESEICRRCHGLHSQNKCPNYHGRIPKQQCSVCGVGRHHKNNCRLKGSNQ